MFTNNSVLIAREEMTRVDPSLVHQYTEVIRFLVDHSEAASPLKGKAPPKPGTRDYISRQAISFSQSRAPHAPTPPSTVPDQMVLVILVAYFGVNETQVERIKREHLLSMGAENIVGELLERYLANVLEPRGWVWCSGSMVRAVDFIKPPSKDGDVWRLLQVKNRDNSENSSSSAIRNGTNIEKWHRTFSKRVGSNWAAFPDDETRDNLSEKAFELFVRQYLSSL